MAKIESYKLDYIPTTFTPNVKIYVKLSNESFVREYITSNTGVPIPLKDEAGAANVIDKVSAENIPSYTPIAIVNNQAYKLDASNTTHKFAFAGFSINGTIIGQTCNIQQTGELELLGWGLIPNTQYLAGLSGAILVNNTNPLNFTKIVGYATTSNTLEIIKDYTTILK